MDGVRENGAVVASKRGLDEVGSAHVINVALGDFGSEHSVESKVFGRVVGVALRVGHGYEAAVFEGHRGPAAWCAG